MRWRSVDGEEEGEDRTRGAVNLGEVSGPGEVPAETELHRLVSKSRDGSAEKGGAPDYVRGHEAVGFERMSRFRSFALAPGDRRERPLHSPEVGHVGSQTGLAGHLLFWQCLHRDPGRPHAQMSVALGRSALAALNRGGENETQRTQSWSRHAPVIPDPPDSQQYL